MGLRLQVSKSRHWGHPSTKAPPVLLVLKRMVDKVKLTFLLRRPHRTRG